MKPTTLSTQFLVRLPPNYTTYINDNPQSCRFFFLWRSPRTFSHCHQSARGNKTSRDVGGRTFIVEYRRGAAAFWARSQIHARHVGEPNRSKAIGKVVQGQALHWWQVSRFRGAVVFVLTAGPRFVSPDIKKKYDLDLPEYSGVDHIVEVGGT